MNRTDSQRYAQFAAQFGETSFQGNSYALISHPEPTNRLFPDSWFDAIDGETYTAEYSAPAMGHDGEEYVARWQFEMVRGNEPEDGADLPCDWSSASEVIPA